MQLCSLIVILLLYFRFIYNLWIFKLFNKLNINELTNWHLFNFELKKLMNDLLKNSWLSNKDKFLININNEPDQN